MDGSGETSASPVHKHQNEEFLHFKDGVLKVEANALQSATANTRIVIINEYNEYKCRRQLSYGSAIYDNIVKICDRFFFLSSDDLLSITCHPSHPPPTIHLFVT